MAENSKKSFGEKEEDQDKKKCVFGEHEHSELEDQTTNTQLVSRRASQNNVKLKEEAHSKSAPPASHSLVREAKRTSCDWRSSKDEKFIDLEPQPPAKTSPAADRQPVPASQLPATEKAGAKADPLKEDEDWLSAALALKKSQAQAKALDAPGEELDVHTPASQVDASTRAPQQTTTPQDKTQSTDGCSQPVPQLSTMKEASAELLQSAKPYPSQKVRAPDEYNVKYARAFQPTDGSNLRARDTCSQASEKSVLEDDLFNRLEEELEFLEVNAAESHFQSASSCLLALLHIQAHVSQLEGQVRTLEMEQAQLRQLLQLLQQQHQEDLDLIACAHRSHMKVVEKNDGQQEERLQQEEQPAAQLPQQRQDTAPAQQHPMSQEQEKHPMSQKQDKQLKELQDRLSQQQRDMAKERSQFLEVIAKLEARLSEQTQVLEQERGRAMVEEAKAKSLQCSLEKQQQFMKQQLSMEREELKRVKNTLLEEQKSMLQKCSEERGKLEAEWAEFHAQEKLREEWLEQKREQSQQIDRTRMRLAKEQEELSFQGHRLRAKEEQLERDREQLDESWHELELEKEKVNSVTQTIQKQKKEIKSMIERSSQKYRVGKRALREAHRIKSLHQDRLQAMQRQLEQLRQHQELLHQDWLSTIQQRRQLEQLCNSAQNLCAPMGSLSSAPCRIHPQHGLGYCRDSTDSSTALYATLQMLRQRAQMELDFLEGERVFLESLKKAPNSA
ncbi:fas-binding factor 1 isoform X2 [Chiroxiphia lanceolata]|uniref:fas-binding factor 1 isoform X2 n=1 Tax=Chiroxiphia lanceolata TaxID=296741 RepID=UPI0013CF0816|nr:fas-binding factor 1 isoform X2 [Chiroxiphia lanceolata]